MNLNNDLSSYLSDNIDVLFNLEDNELSKFEETISEDLLDVKFKELPAYIEKHKKHFDLIFQNNRYEMSYNNIGTILEYELEDFDKESFDKSNLTYILESEVDYLLDYISQDDYESYITNVYSKLEENQNENEDNILAILDLEELSTEKRTEFLIKQENKINSIYDLADTDFFSIVFEHNKIECTWQNIYNYYIENDKSFNETLIYFLNNSENYFQLGGTSKIDLKIDNDKQNEFIQKLISSKSLANDSFEILVESIPENYFLPDKFDFKSINQDKANLLIEHNHIKLNVYNFDELKSNFPDSHINLLPKIGTIF